MTIRELLADDQALIRAKVSSRPTCSTRSGSSPGGEALLSPKATKALIARYLASPEPATGAAPAELAALTEREREVLTLVAAGLSNDAIAERLYVSPLTAKTHVNRIMAKLGARDRAQLVVVAYQTGFARSPSP